MASERSHLFFHNWCPLSMDRQRDNGWAMELSVYTNSHLASWCCDLAKRHSFNGTVSSTIWLNWYQNGRTNLDLLEQEIVSGSGISWAICISAPRSRHITTPASHRSVFLQTRCHSHRATNSNKALKDKALVTSWWTNLIAVSLCISIQRELKSFESVFIICPIAIA